MARRHDIKAIIYHCEEPDCNFKSKRKDSLIEHIVNKHDIEFKTYYCKDFATNYKYSLSRHLTAKHGINDILYRCEVSDCDFETKLRESLKSHLATKQIFTGNRFFVSEGCP